jgi:hypothetical protein
LNPLGGASFGSILCGVILSIQINIYSQIFNSIAIKLNNRENYRTDTDYEDALIVKKFTFDFFNSYLCLFYIAFVKPFIPLLDSCPSNGCLGMNVADDDDEFQ